MDLNQVPSTTKSEETVLQCSGSNPVAAIEFAQDLKTHQEPENPSVVSCPEQDPSNIPSEHLRRKQRNAVTVNSDISCIASNSSLMEAGDFPVKRCGLSLAKSNLNPHGPYCPHLNHSKFYYDADSPERVLSPDDTSEAEYLEIPLPNEYYYDYEKLGNSEWYKYGIWNRVTHDYMSAADNSAEIFQNLQGKCYQAGDLGVPLYEYISRVTPYGDDKTTPYMYINEQEGQSQSLPAYAFGVLSCGFQRKRSPIILSSKEQGASSYRFWIKETEQVICPGEQYNSTNYEDSINVAPPDDNPCNRIQQEIQQSYPNHSAHQNSVWNTGQNVLESNQENGKSLRKTYADSVLASGNQIQYQRWLDSNFPKITSANNLRKPKKCRESIAVGPRTVWSNEETSQITAYPAMSSMSLSTLGHDATFRLQKVLSYAQSLQKSAAELLVGNLSTRSIPSVPSINHSEKINDVNGKESTNLFVQEQGDITSQFIPKHPIYMTPEEVQYLLDVDIELPYKLPKSEDVEQSHNKKKSPKIRGQQKCNQNTRRRKVKNK